MPYYRRRFTFGRKRVVRKRRVIRRRRFVRRAKLFKEYKTYDVYSTSANMIPAGTFVPLLTMSKGTDAVNRVGEQIVVKSFQMRANISGKQGAPATDPFYNRVRVLLLEDKQSLHATPTLAEILQYVTMPIQSPILQGAYRRFKVLIDKVYNLDYDDPLQGMRVYKKLNVPVIFTNGQATPQANNMFMVLLSDQADDFPIMEYFARIRFTDA